MPSIKRSRVSQAQIVIGSDDSRTPYQVLARALCVALDLAELEGITDKGVFTGLPFDACALRQLRSIDWQDYCLACERLEMNAGGPQACQDLLARSYHRVLPEFRSLVGSLVSPLSFAKLTLEVLSPIVGVLLLVRSTCCACLWRARPTRKSHSTYTAPRTQ